MLSTTASLTAFLSASRSASGEIVNIEKVGSRLVRKRERKIMDAITEDNFYLQPDFDANKSLKVADLRRILLQHDIDFPSSAKKSVLVDLFNQHLTGTRARKLLSAKKRVRPSNSGIRHHLESSPVTDRESGTEEQPTSRKSKSPPVKLSASPNGVRYGSDSEHFSDVNPFQSRPGSPNEIEDKRRQTLPPPSMGKDKAERSPRRKTDTILVRKRRTVSPNVPTTTTTTNLDASEEFTPQEMQELQSSREAQPSSPAKFLKLPSQGFILSICSLLLPLSLLWTHEKVSIGYCGTEPRDLLVDYVPTEYRSWLDPVYPTCIPCPAHAECFTGLQLQCEPDHLLLTHPLSLEGRFPLPPPQLRPGYGEDEAC